MYDLNFQEWRYKKKLIEKAPEGAKKKNKSPTIQSECALKGMLSFRKGIAPPFKLDMP